MKKFVSSGETKFHLVRIFCAAAVVLTAAAFFGILPDLTANAQRNEDKNAPATDVSRVQIVENNPAVPTAPPAIANYAFGATTATLEDMTGGTTIISTSVDDTVSASQALPFDFFFMGAGYNRYCVSPDGWVRLMNANSAACTNSFTNDLTLTTNTPKIAPYWDDLATGTTGNVIVKEFGTAPNRKFVVQWFVVVPRVTTNAANTTFQAWLYEGTGAIQYVYGAVPVTTNSYSVGLTATTGAFASITTSTDTNSTSTANNTQTAAIAAGKSYTYTPPAITPAAPTNLTFTAITPSSVTLNWVDNSSDETSFPIAISTDGGATYNFIGAAAENATSVTVTGLLANTTYFFRVQAATEGRASTPLINSITTAPPISGTKTIGPGGDYTTFSAAINDLNGGVGTGGLIFNVTAGTTFAEATPCITAQGTMTDQVIFQKSGAGANPIIQPPGSASTQDAGVCILGGDYITFDNIDVTVATGVTTVEYGYLLFNSSATNGAQNNTIRNSKITLNRANTASVGIFQSSSSAATSAAGAQSNNKYHNIVVENSYRGIQLAGNGTTFPDTANEVGTTGGGLTVIGAATANDIGNGSSQSWGIRATSQSGVRIFNTVVRNITTSAAVADGIFLETFIGTCVVSGNKVSNVRNASTTSTASNVTGIRMSHNTTGANIAQVFNNFVSGITSGFTGTATATRQVKGIFVSGTGGSTTQEYNIDFNSVRMDGSGSLNVSNTAFEVSTTTGPIYRVRNNIFANFTGAQTGVAQHFTWVSPTAGTIGPAGSVSNFNDLYVDNTTNGFVGRGSTTNYATLANWQTGVSQDANSISVNPQFVSATDLHIVAASPAIDVGTPIVGITTDIDNETRPNGAQVDIGADEFVPLPGTLQLSSTTYGGAESTNVQITVNRVSGSSGTVGVTYTLTDGTATGGAACGAGVDYVNPGPQTLTFGDGVTSQMFNVTLCADGVIDVGETFTVTLSMPTGGALLGSPTTATVTITDIAPPFSGSISVGGASPYTSLTNANGIFEALNNSGAVGNVVINIDGDLLSETGAFPLNELAGGFTVTIKPSGGIRQISGTSATAAPVRALIRINGADNVTIDGSLNGSFDRSLTITNSDTDITAGVVHFGSGTNGAQNGAIRNVIVVGGGSTTTLTGISFGGNTSTTSAGLDNDNKRIENCDIRRVQRGISTSGASAANKDAAGLISRNNLNNPSPNNIGQIGIIVSFEDNIQITRNGIGEIISSTTTRYSIGISLGGLTSASNGTTTGGSEVSNAFVSRNAIGRVQHTATYGAFGILAAPSATGTNRIDNNLISGVAANGTVTDFAAGIFVIDSGTDSTTQLYYNTVSMSGAAPAGGSQPNYGMAVNGTDPIIELKNNIFFNTQTAAVGSYAIGLGYAIFANFDSNFNDLYVTPGGTPFFVGKTGGISSSTGTNRADLAAWQTATTDDGNSVSVDPLFLSLTDLHLQPTSPVRNIGTPIAAVPFDYDGQPRPNPTDALVVEVDLGGDEWFPALAAGASISGRVTAADGRGIRNAVISVSGGGLSQPRFVRTTSFGYYTIEDLEVGGTYIVTVNSKRFTFTVPSRVITLNENVEDADFIAEVPQ